MASKVKLRSSPSGQSFRRTLLDPIMAKTCYFYKDGDLRTEKIKIAIHPGRYRRLETLYQELSSKMRDLPYGVRSIFTPQGNDAIRLIDELENNGHYICSTYRHRAEGLDLNRLIPRVRWSYNKPPSGQRNLNALLHDPDFEDPPRVKKARYTREHRMAYEYNRSLPKKITVLRNGDPKQQHILLINRRTAQNFDQIMSDLSDMFGSAIHTLYTMEGRRVSGLAQLFNGPEVLVAGGKEPFRYMVGEFFEPRPPAGQPLKHTRSRLNTGDFVANKMRDRRDRMLNTKGRWKVWITTNELSTAGTTAQVTLTVYGHKGSSSLLPLGFGDGQHFQSGHIDEFDINVGSIGEIYKIRIAHDNTGSFPGWLCDEVRMMDKDTNEELIFPVKRWLARDEDDHEICRELPVVRRGDPNLPVIKYDVAVVTGDLWNGGTDANVYLTIYGERGDTGVRQLYSPFKDKVFRKGQMDHFTIEAVSLGKLKRVIVGHDGTNPGDGWFLEKIIISEPDAKPHETSIFHCNRWLDEGEDDGKIVRELSLQDGYMDDILAKRNWEFEKWKFENKNQVMLFSLVTGKALRIKVDGTVDGLGERADPGAIFSVSSKKPMVRIFTSQLNSNFHLAIDNGKVVGHGRGGPYCEFRIHVQNNLTVMLEGVKSPLQFVSLLESGKLGDPRSILDHDPGKHFHVYCKGILRQHGVLMLRTSNTQAVNVDHDLNVSGRGKCSRPGHFRVHKIDQGGVRLFESMVYPEKFLRLFDGKIDCQGGRDENSHFIVTKHKDKGYITLQSKIQRGIFLGLTPKGEVRPTVDTGVSNVWLFPEVVEFGVPKEQLEKEIQSPEKEVESKKKKQEVIQGDWKVTVDTIENLEHGDVVLVVYGDKGSSGPINLEPPVKNGLAFRAGNTDEFKTNLLKVGQVYKVRLELLPKSMSRSPAWKVGSVKMADLNGKNELIFKFNRWLSLQYEDGDTMRELPVVNKGKEVLPVRKYEVMVYTGKEENADTKAQIYLNVFGEHGDWGKRILHKSNNKIPFQRDQVDIFEVEAVSLGHLSQCLIGHDGTKAGDGWYLENIVVKEGKSGSQYTFPCKKWLDSGKEDRKVERILHVKESGTEQATEPAPEVVERQKTEPPHEKPQAGDWKVQVTTGADDDMRCLDTVVLFAYGDRGFDGPILLGHGADGVFSPSITDEFKIHIDPAKTGELYKIRLGLSEKIFRAQWFLEKMKMIDQVKGDSLKFGVRRWLSRVHDDHDVWRELPVSLAGKQPLPVHQYQVKVHTGDIADAETEAEVFITIFGERGDTGKRRLYKSKSEGKPFTRGKVDMFVVEAVSLGMLKKVVVLHRGSEAGERWYLSDITVFESDKANSLQVYFPCNRWLDAGKDDYKTKVELFPGEKPQESKGEYQLWVKTADDSSPANGGKVSIAVYGSKGSSKDIELFAPSKQSQLFEPGNIDEFEIATGNIGEIYKLRVNREDTKSWKAWHLEEVKLRDRATSQTLVFRFDCWFSRDMDDHELVRELAVVKDRNPVLPAFHYEVTTLTGDHWAGGTDSTVYITLKGIRGDSGKRILYTPQGKRRTFRQGQEDKFNIEAVDLGDLKSVVIGHDGKGPGAGWFLDQVVVKVKKAEGGRFTFPCMRWLDRGEDDGKIERELRHIGVPDMLHVAPLKSRNDSTGEWKVLVKTSDVDGAATTTQVYLTVYGVKGTTPPLPLGDGSLASDYFLRGKESEFRVKLGKIGEITKIRIGLDNKSSDHRWHVDYVKMVDTLTDEEYFFPVNRWLAADRDDGQLHRECAVMSPGAAPVPVLRYMIMVQTGRQKSAGASGGNISVTLIGSNGDTGQQTLLCTVSNPADRMMSGKIDVYMLEAVSVGTLKSLRLVFHGNNRAKKWYVERITVMESISGLEEAIFDFNCWLDSERDNSKEVHTKELQVASLITDDVVHRVLGHDPIESHGHWEASVWTGQESDAGTKDPVLLILYGTNGHTEPIHLNKNTSFNPGSAVKVKIDAGSIGQLFKVRLMFAESTGRSLWIMERMKLTDLDTNQEFHFDNSIRVESSPKNPDGCTELPAIRPDIAPLPETTYLVTVITGNQPRAETDAEIFCTLIGQWGDTGERILSDSKSHGEPFRRGQTDSFEIKTLYLGNVTKLMIGHNESGRGCGWFCKQITVHTVNAPALDKRAEIIFDCNRWLDSGCEDRKLVRELIPSGSIIPSDAGSKVPSRGVWTCKVKMAAEDRLDASLPAISLPEQVSVTVFGSHGVRGPIELQDETRDLFLLGHIDEFRDLQIGDIGEVQKLRVCAGREDDDNPVWMVEWVNLEDSDTKQMLRFNFSRWIGMVGGDVTLEVPTLHLEKPFMSVVQYEVQMYTANTKDAGTKSSVFINIFGKNGESGRRRLLKSSRNKTPFQNGKTDVFIVEAVDLGNIEKIMVTKGPGDSWQLDQVKVKAGVYASLIHVFNWNKCIGDDNHRSEDVEVTILVSASWPSPVAIPAEQNDDLPASAGHWSVNITSSEEPSEGDVSDLVLVMCGAKGESSPLRFHSTRSHPFQPGQTDTAEVHLAQDVGDLFKVRLGFADILAYKTLHIARVKFEDIDTKDNFSSNLNTSLKVNDSRDGWVEFPVVWPAVHVFPVIKYRVSVVTGDVENAETKADIYIELHGHMGSTGKRHLRKSLTNSKMFQRNQTDVFELEAVTLLTLEKVVIGHSQAKTGEGWFLKKVVVTPDGQEPLEFHCNRWLDAGEDDGRTERTLNLKDKPARTPDLPPPVVSPAQKPKSPRQPSPPKEKAHKWRVWTSTGHEVGQGTHSSVALVLYGDKGRTEAMILGDSEDERFHLIEGQTQKFEVGTNTDIGKPYKLRVGFADDADQMSWYSDFTLAPTWFLERIKLENVANNKQYVFEARQWIRLDEDHDHWQEFPVYTADRAKMLPIIQYYVEVFTGDKNRAETEANIFLEIYGQRGDTGKRHLHGSTTNRKAFERNQRDVFIIEAVDLGKLQKVLVSHDGIGAGSGWYLDQITIRESANGKEKYVFNCEKWLDEGKGDGATERELPLTGVVSEEPEPVNSLPAGDWQVQVVTSAEEGSGTDANVSLTVYGDKGCSGALPLKSDDRSCFQQGKTDIFNIWLEPEEIGKIQKVRLQHDNSGMTDGWRVDKIVLTNDITQEVLEFPVRRWLSFREKHGDIVFEAPVVRPNEKPLAKYKYLVKTVTEADADSTAEDVYVILVGSLGDTGRRELKQNLEEHGKFQTGQTDTFIIEAVDLGSLEKVIVGLSNPGPEDVWKLQCIVVRVSEKESFVFPWGKWLNEEHPEAEIPLANVVDDGDDEDDANDERAGRRPQSPPALRSPRHNGGKRDKDRA